MQVSSAEVNLMSRADGLRSLRALADLLQRRRVPLSVQGARGLGFLVEISASMIEDNLPVDTFDDSPGDAEP